MATLSNSNPTLADLSMASGPDGKISPVVEILSQVNEVLDDMTWVEGNLPTGHRTTIRSGLPTPTWRKLYGGVQPSKSSRVQITDSCGMLEAYAEVDKALADLNGNTQAFRLSEDKAHIEGMSQEMASTLFYGNEGTTPEAFTGLAPRYNTLGAENADSIINGQGAGADNTSIWLVVWGPDTVHGIVPKGSKTGLQHTDKGAVTIENVDGSGGRMEAYRTHYRWDCGLTVRDWRYVVRIANIDVSALTATAESGANLLDLLAQATRRVPNLSTGRAVFYANRTIQDFLDRQSMNKATLALSTQEDAQGKFVTAFRKIPVRRSDALLDTEAAVS